MKLAVFYGGDSPECDISTISGVQALNQLDGRFETYPIFVRGGVWYMPKNSADMNTYRRFDPSPCDRVELRGDTLCRLRRNKVVKPIAKIDCALICMHGGWGENGSLQGLLEVCGVPYTSPGVAASAIGMDKALSKRYFQSMGCDVLDAICVRRGDDALARIGTFVTEHGFPIIVKPNAQGSSIGIEIAHDMMQLSHAIETAFAYDDCVLVEHALSDFTEINCACVATRRGTLVSSLEQPIGWKEILSFETKYLTDGKMSGGGRIFPAPLDSDLTQAIQRASQTVYEGLRMQGVVRFDYLLDGASGKFYLNEMNTVPGSLAYYLFADKQIGYSELVEIMCRVAIERAGQRTSPVFRSEVLSKYDPRANCGKMGCKS